MNVKMSNSSAISWRDRLQVVKLMVMAIFTKRRRFFNVYYACSLKQESVGRYVIRTHHHNSATPVAIATSKVCQLFCRIYFDLVMNAVLELELNYFLIDKLVLLDFEGVCFISIISLSQSLVQ
jgi:hypothetical protein